VRFQFPVYKMFLIVAAYAVAFRMSVGMGIFGAVLALWVGTAGSLLIVAIRSKKDVLVAIRGGLGGMIGWCFGLMLTPMYMRFTVQNQITVTVIQSACVLVGVLLLSGASKLDERLRGPRA
jgi:hypothetical protein